MKIYIDFDGTLFNNNKHYHKLINILKKYNITEEYINNLTKSKHYKNLDNLAKEIIINKEPITKEEQEAQKKIVKIDIKGQVINPGVYELSENARVMDVINMAGGLTDIANTSLINLSKKLEDQMVIIIYSDEEVLNGVSS